MNRDLHPTEGARYLLERTEDAGERATYRAVIYTPSSEHAAIASVSDDGAYTLSPTGAPGDLDDRLAVMVKLLARDAAKRRDEGLPVWPARVLRWRK